MKQDLASYIPADWGEHYESERRFLLKALASLKPETVKKLIKAAVGVRKNAYPPYSHFYVGASVLGASGRIYASCNAEVVSWSDSDHAEQSTVTKAISEGEIKKSGRTFIRAVAVSANGSPCGRCRQVIAEHADNAVIFITNPKGEIQYIVSLGMLLPLAFTPKDLEK